jgi:hypothetical protein
MTWQLMPLLLLFLCCSCGTAPVSPIKGATIYYIGTQEYARKAAVLKLSPEDARKLVLKQISNEGQSAEKLKSIYGSHQLISCHRNSPGFLLHEKVITVANIR